MARPESRTSNTNNETSADVRERTSGLPEALVNALQGLLGTNNSGESKGNSGRDTNVEDPNAPSTEEIAKMMSTEEGAKERKAQLLKIMKPCPVCQGRHTYKRRMRWGQMEWPSDRLESCSKFSSHGSQPSPDYPGTGRVRSLYKLWTRSKEMLE